jgi:hypothetical protein
MAHFKRLLGLAKVWCECATAWFEENNGKGNGASQEALLLSAGFVTHCEQCFAKLGWLVIVRAAFLIFHARFPLIRLAVQHALRFGLGFRHPASAARRFPGPAEMQSHPSDAVLRNHLHAIGICP